jgi:hypothetical protein
MTQDDRKTRHLFALLHQANITNRQDRLNLYTNIIGRPVHSTNDLTPIELQALIQTLDYWNRNNELHTQTQHHIRPPK